jgi:hypothetical protein
MDLLIVVGVSLAVCLASFMITRLVAAGLRRAAGYFYAAVQPPSLTRLTTILAQRLEEWQAAEAAKRGYELPPPPEIVLALRAFARRERPHVARSLSR